MMQQSRLRHLFHPVKAGLLATGSAAFTRFRFWRWRTFGRPYRWLEASKARPRRERENFYDKYCQGKGLDIGYGGDLVTPTAQGFDIEHGDAQSLSGIPPEAYDFVHASHVLEDLDDPREALRNWWRTLKPGGFLIIFVPHRDLYERRTRLPSRWNTSHRHFFLPLQDDPPDTLGLEPLVRDALPDARIEYTHTCAEGHAVPDPDAHSDGEYSIELVAQKPK